jgi:hypothetical protein
MPPAFDPRVFYTKYTAVADFILIWALLTLLIKWIFVRIKYAAKSKKGLGGMFMGALSSEDQKTLFSLEGLMSAILGLMMTLGGMTYYNWSLKAVFTGDTFPIVMSIIVGAMGYNVASTRTKNLMIRLATALFAGGIAFGFLAYKTRAGADWLWWFFWFPLFLLMIFSLQSEVKATKEGRAPARTGAAAAQEASSDVKAIKKKLDESQGEVVKLKKQADEAEKKQSTLLQDVQKALTAVTSTLSNQLKNASATSMMFAASLQVGALMFSNGASADEVRNELRKRNTSADIIEATVSTLSPQVPPQQLQPAAKPSAAPAPAPAKVKVAPPAPESTPLPPTVSEKIKKAVTVDLATFESAQDDLIAQVHNFEEIASGLETLPGKMRDVSSIGMRVHGELEQFAQAAAKLAEDTKSFPDMAGKTEQLHHDASYALNSADLENRQFKASTDPLFSILSSDAGQLQRIAQELKANLQEVSRQLDILDKNTRRLKMGKGNISVADIQLYNAAYQTLEKQLIGIEQILAHHGDPVKTVLVALPGTAEAVENARKVFDQLDGDLSKLFGRYADLFEQVQKIQQAKVAEEEREGLRRIDVRRIKDSTLTLDSIVTGLLVTPIQKVQGAGSSQFIVITKGEVFEMQTQAQNALNLMRDLDSERQKVVDMATGNAELNLLSQKLADLQGLPLKNDLLAFANNKKLNGMADNAKGDSKLGRAMAQILIGMLGRTDPDKLGSLLNDIRTASGNLPKGAVQ